MDYAIALKRGVAPESLPLAALLGQVPGVRVNGANTQRAQVTVESERALAALREALGERCHIELVKPRKVS